MKVVILAGGYGTRLSEYTKLLPKPMIPIGKIPILQHIIKIYANQNINEFYIATGYKSHKIKSFFKKYNVKNNFYKFSDLKKIIKIKFIMTGHGTMTGGRLKKLKNYFSKEDFMFTYGDGLANINLKKLYNFHKKHKKIATVTAVRPPARYGILNISNNKVKKFKEKPQLDSGWVNGGFFVLNYKVFKYLRSDQTIFEKAPLEKLARKGELYAYKHFGFWQCMDNKRDKEVLEKLYRVKKKIPWEL